MRLQIQRVIQRQMLNQNPKPYFNQVAMIESQYESKRRNLANSNNSNIFTNKSPLRERDRQNMNSINTPSRAQSNNCMISGNTNKVSLSPIRSRRNGSQAPMASTRSTAISRRKSNQNYCENHAGKVAKFMIDKDGQYFYFCDRCAIPLISNGFKLTKISDQDQRQPENPRTKQITQFLRQLESMQVVLGKKKQGISQIINKGQGQLDLQLQKIQQFYGQFYQIIDQHKRRVIQQMKSEYEKSSRNVNMERQKVQQAIKDSKNMKQDIVSSMNSVILQAMQNDYRSVMNQYYENLDSFKEICNTKFQQPIKVRTLCFKQCESVCQALIQGLVIEWNDQDGQIQQQSVHKGNERARFQNNQFSKQNYSINRASRRREEQESDRQNPIECLQTEQRKSIPNVTNKELGGLFCSFDQ